MKKFYVTKDASDEQLNDLIVKMKLMLPTVSELICTDLPPQYRIQGTNCIFKTAIELAPSDLHKTSGAIYVKKCYFNKKFLTHSNHGYSINK